MYYLYAILCAVLWAVGYSVLTLFNQALNQFTIGMMYGFWLVVSNLAAMLVTGTMDNVIDIANNPLIFVYVVVMGLASFLSMVAYAQAAGNASIVSAISSTYPMVQLVLMAVFLPNAANSINYVYVVPSIACIAIGVAGLALSK